MGINDKLILFLIAVDPSRPQTMAPLYLFGFFLSISTLFASSISKGVFPKRNKMTLDSLNILIGKPQETSSGEISLDGEELTSEEFKEAMALTEQCNDQWRNFKDCYEETSLGWQNVLSQIRNGRLSHAVEKLSRTSRTYNLKCSPVLHGFQECCANDLLCPFEEVEKEVSRMLDHSELMVGEISKEITKHLRSKSKQQLIHT